MLLAGIAAPLLLGGLGASSFEGDEAIYAEVVREAVDGAWFPLRYNGEPFLYPPLKLWAGALVAAGFGIGEGALRAIDGACGLATILLVHAVAAPLLGRAAAWLSSLLLLGLPNLLFEHGLRSFALDAPLVLLTSAGLLVYLTRRLGSMEGFAGAGFDRRRELRTVAGAGLLLGAACWTKFPVPGLEVVALVAWELLCAPRGARLRGALLAVATGVATLLVYLPAPLLSLASQGGRYLDFLGWHLVQRSLGQVSVGVPDKYYYYNHLRADFGPALWLAVAAGAVAVLWSGWRGSRRGRAVAGFALWAFVVVVFHQAVTAKNAWYLYPAYPAIALLAGAAAGWPLEAAHRRSPVLALVGVGALVAYLGAGVSRSWEQVRAPVSRSDPDRVATYLRALGRPRLCQAAGTDLEAWDYFYLRPHLTRTRVTRDLFDRCDFLLTHDPWRALPAGADGRQFRWLRAHDLDRRPVALVALRGELPPPVRSLAERPVAALWGRVLLADGRTTGVLARSRYWSVEARLRGTGGAPVRAGDPARGAVVWHLVDEPYDYARIPLADAWLPGGQEAALIVSGLADAPLRLLLQPAPTAEAEPQLLEIESEAGRRWTYRVDSEGAIEVELPLVPAEIRGDPQSAGGRAALRIWSTPWVPRALRPGDLDTRHLGLRLLAIDQGDRSLWRLAEIPAGARGRPLTPEAAP